MANLSKWSVVIECDHISGDTHSIVVDAISAKDAMIKAKQWAVSCNIQNPRFGKPYKDICDVCTEWTVDEEDFLEYLTIPTATIEDNNGNSTIY